MPDGIPAQGVTLHVSTETSPTTFQKVGNVTSFSGPSGSRTTIPAPNLDSDTGVTKLKGILDWGQWSFDVNCDPADTGQDEVYEALRDGSTREFKVTLTDTDTLEIHFNAKVVSFPYAGAVDGKVERSLTVDITGDVWEV